MVVFGFGIGCYIGCCIEDCIDFAFPLGFSFAILGVCFHLALLDIAVVVARVVDIGVALVADIAVDTVAVVVFVVAEGTLLFI